MTEKHNSIPFNEALKYVASDLQDKVTRVQEESTQTLARIVLDYMTSMGLHSEDGWRADVKNLQFIKVNNASVPDDSNSDLG